MKAESAALPAAAPPLHRVVVTGLGAITAHGYGWPLVRQAFAAGATAFTAVGGFSGGAAALVSELAPFQRAFPATRPPLPVRQTRMVLLAALEALADARWDTSSPCAQAGVMLDRGVGAAAVVTQFLDPVLRQGPRRSSPLLYAQSVANAPVGAVAVQFGLRGPSLLTMGGGALYLALRSLQRGEASAILCGGFEEIEANVLASWSAQGYFCTALPPSAMRLYDRQSQGALPGEGAVCLLLETAEHAAQRGARIYAELRSVVHGLGCFAEAPCDDAELLGWGRPDEAAFAEWATESLAKAAVPSDSVDLIVGGGNGIAALDQAELSGLAKLGLSHLTPRSLKKCLGESLGMACAASLAWAAESLAGGAATVSLMTNLDFHGQYCAAVATRWIP